VAPRGASAEFILRQITRGVADSTGASTDAFQHKLTELLADEDSGMQLQEMILRVNAHNGQEV
ncbi:hypothetical protein, partial [Parvimonas sp. M13]|uniref:hypothetical protein n=1 Tax=Parvimonas sp. M13 TaxID=3110694 RepID=UPI002B489BFB